MKVFALGDLHLGFKVNKPMEIFGKHWESHSYRIEEAWREKVSRDDLVIIPGDISWATRLEDAKVDLDWLEALPGTKVCIKGNHDYWWDKPKKLNESYETITFLQNKAFMVGKLAICGTRGWISPNTEGFTQGDERIYQREVQRLQLSLDDALKKKAEEIWVMLHYPPIYNGEYSSSMIELIQTYPVSRVLYGHLHDEASWKLAKQGMGEGVLYELVSADYLGFSPLLLKEYEEEIESGE